jgi:hypothetical protein
MHVVDDENIQTPESAKLHEFQRNGRLKKEAVARLTNPLPAPHNQAPPPPDYYVCCLWIYDALKALEVSKTDGT